MDKKDFLGLYAGIGDVIENGKRIGECIFNLEIFMLPSGKIEAEGIIVEITEGEVNFEGRNAEFKISGIISKNHDFYATEFSCKTSPSIYPKFVANVDELFKNLESNS